MNWLAIGGILGGVVALCQFSLMAYNSVKGGEARQKQAEAAKATLDVAQAEASLPHIAKSLELGNVAEAVSIQQGIINGLREHVIWQDKQLEERDAKIAECERRLEERDAKIDELGRRLELAEESLTTAKRLIRELRATSAVERRVD